MNTDQLVDVVIIEDNDELREMYKGFIDGVNDYRIVNTYSGCEQALKTVKKDDPDLVLIDLTFPGMGGIEGISRLKKINPDLPILVVTVHDDREHVFDALCAGASGYLTKDFKESELFSAMEQVINGGGPMSPRIASLIIRSYHNNPKSPLTDRETDVLKGLANGSTYSHIAEKLGLSTNTIRTHVKHIYDKLQVQNKTDALIRARKDRLV